MCAWDETDRHPCSPHKGTQHAAVAALGIYSKGVGAPPASYAYDLKIMIILGMSNIVFIAFSVI